MKPLAYRMRPTNLDEVVGQRHLIGPGKIIRRMVEARLLSSMILSALLASVRQVLLVLLQAQLNMPLESSMQLLTAKSNCNK